MKSLFHHLTSVFAILPIASESITRCSEFAHPVVLAISAGLTIGELVVLARKKKEHADESISVCLIIASIGASMWIIGILVSLMWIHHLGYLIYASGHVTKSVKEILRQAA